MNLVIEEVVEIYPVLVTEEVFVVEIKDTLAFLDLTDVSDSTYVGKEGFVPTVNEATGKLELKATTGGGGAVDSVNGQVGVVLLDADDIPTTATNVYVTPTEKTAITHTNRMALDLVSGTNTGDQDLSVFVPYTGATTNVDLGEFQIKAGQVEFDQTPTGAFGVGMVRWNDADGTLDLGLKGGNVTLQVGQEQVLRVVNKTATNVSLLESNYQAVRVTGAQGQRLKVDLALATNDLLSAETIGLVTETIANNQEGFITTSGLIRGINTTGSLQGETWVDGDVIYLSPTVAGGLTNVKPIAPNHLIIIGYVVSAHITQGTIFVKVDNGYELDELHNVAISTPLDTQVLTYESSTSLWKNKILPIGTLLPETHFYTGSQIITLLNNYSQVHSVSVSGGGSLLKDSEYTLIVPNQIDFGGRLEVGDYIIVQYSTTAVGLQPYYSQAQVDALIFKGYKSAIDGVSVANTLTITPTYVQPIPAGKFVAGDLIYLKYRATAPSAKTSTTNIYVYVNTTDNLNTGSPTQLGLFNTTTTGRTAQLERTISIKGAISKLAVVTGANATDTTQTAAMSTLTIDWTIPQYIIFAIGHTVADQTMFGDFYQITKI